MTVEERVRRVMGKADWGEEDENAKKERG